MKKNSSEKFISKYFREISTISSFINYEEINNLVIQLKNLKKRKGRLFILGVGGSAGNASHAVNDFRKLCNIESYAPTDNVPELSARTNDEGWETVFSSWLEVSKVNKKDSLFILSVGGGNKKKQISTNLIKAIDYVKKKKLKIFGVIGKKDGYTKKKEIT